MEKKYKIVDENGKVLEKFRLSCTAQAMLKYYKKAFRDKLLVIVRPDGSQLSSAGQS